MIDEIKKDEQVEVRSGATLGILSAKYAFTSQGGRVVLFAIIETEPEQIKKIEPPVTVGSSVAPRRGKTELLSCSFCGKSQYDIKKLIAGPGVFVCNECIDICNEIIADDDKPKVEAQDQPQAEKPKAKAKKKPRPVKRTKKAGMTEHKA